MVGLYKFETNAWKMEPALEAPELHRYTVLPIQELSIFQLYKQHRASFWVEEEVFAELSKDYQQFQKLPPATQRLVRHVIAFFAVSDEIVNEAIDNALVSRIRNRELKIWYNFQMAMEDIHAIMYSHLVETYFPDPKERDATFKALETFPAIHKKIRWYQHWMSEPNAPLARLIYVNAIMEGLFFQGAFCVIFWITDQYSALRGLSKSNEWISRDEGMHTEMAILLYNKYIKNRLSQEEAHNIMREALAIEEESVAAELSEPLPRMNAMLMRQYLQFVADGLLRRLGYDTIYNVQDPLLFTKRQSASVRITDFFGGSVSEYGLAHANTSPEDNEPSFNI